MIFEYSRGGKWLELLKQIAPGVTRVAVVRYPTQSGTSQFAAIQTAASLLRVEVTPVSVRDTGEIERGVAAFAGSPNGGLIVTGRSRWQPGTDCPRSLLRTFIRRRRRPDVLWG
jgi:putative ABC transport system substrate-binding protein